MKIILKQKSFLLCVPVSVCAFAGPKYNLNILLV